MKREEIIQTKGREQRAESRGQSVIGHWSLPARLCQSGGVIGKQEPVCALCIAPEKSGQAVDFLPVRQAGSQRNREHDMNSGLQPNNMWIKPVSKINEYRLTNEDLRSGANNMVPHFLPDSYRVLISYFLFLRSVRLKINEYRLMNEDLRSGANNMVSHFLFLISYFLFPNSLNADRSKDAVRFKTVATAADLTVPIAIGINVGQSGLQPHSMGIEPVAKINEYRLTNEDLRSGANNMVSHFLPDSYRVLIPYSLFLRMWLKPDSDNNFSIRQLKQTAKDRAAMCNISAVSFAVEFIQRIIKYNVRIGLQPHTMWLKPVFDCNYSVRQLKQTAMEGTIKRNISAVSIAPEKSGQAVDFIAVDFLPVRQAGSQRIRKHMVRNGLQPHTMWLKPVFDCNYSVRQLKQTAINSASHGALTNEISTVCLPSPLDPPEVNSGQALKGSARIRTELVAGFVCGISPLGVRGSAGFEMITKRNSTVFHIIKPSATGTSCLTEGCISESRTVRACPSIRFFNN